MHSFDEAQLDDSITHKQLKLKILNEPLNHFKSSNKCSTSTCCLCCRDLTDSLEHDERAIKLTMGFIREY